MDTAGCNNDGHDCSFFLKNFPDCHVPEPERLGNGHCDGNIYFTNECAFDGGDCSSCNVTYPSWVGDRICDGNEYLTTGCSMDAGDCAACLSHGIDPLKIGDGICHMELNTTECGWDGHDCLESPKLAPCIVELEDWLGDGFCGKRCYECITFVWHDAQVSYYELLPSHRWWRIQHRSLQLRWWGLFGMQCFGT